MKLDFTYKPSSTIQDLTQAIRVNYQVLGKLPQSNQITKNIRMHHLLQSSVYSAQIEGNPLNIGDVTPQLLDSIKPTTHQQEIHNLLDAYEFIFTKTPTPIDISIIQKLHQLAMYKLASAGHFRQEQSAIFASSGQVVYLPPPANEVQSLLQQLIFTYGHPNLVKAIIFHFGFEKIHPFLDGNGRVGRLLLTHHLNLAGFNFQGLLILEEFIHTQRDDYYDFLASNSSDLTDWIIFFLQGIHTQTESLLQKIDTLSRESNPKLLQLLPRRQEIVHILADHNTVSFDFLHRRFFQVPKSTLHHDLNILVKQGFVRKLGTTRGVVYQAV